MRHPTGTRKAAWSNHLHSCAGYSDRYSGARAKTPSREAGLATWYVGRVENEKKMYTMGIDILDWYVPPCVLSDVPQAPPSSANTTCHSKLLKHTWPVSDTCKSP